MLDWKTPEIWDIPEMKKIISLAGAKGSDCSAANIFLLREKYNIRIAFENGFLYRWYSGTRLPGRSGVAFPLGARDVSAAVRRLREDRRERGFPEDYIFLTETQKEWLAREKPEMEFAEGDGNADYLYTARHLAELAGKDNRKKRNRVSRFCREYPDMAVFFSDMADDRAALLKDMLAVEEEWFASQEERMDSVFVERHEIKEAVANWQELGLLGAVIYAQGRPAAMTVASEISPGIVDIHFEKCYGEYAQAGGFAAINQYFARFLVEQRGIQWINREEDIGLPGLRRAKMAYRPDRMLEKYHTVKG